MKEEILKCDHCGKEVRYFRSEKKLGTIEISEVETYEYQTRIDVVVEMGELCGDCTDLLISLMNHIFDNRVWREVDKVYECRWDCKNMRLEAA